MLEPTYIQDLNFAIKELKVKCADSNLKSEDKIRIQYYKALIYAISTYHAILKDKKLLEKPESKKEEPNPFILELMELMKVVKEKRENLTPSFHSLPNKNEY